MGIGGQVDWSRTDRPQAKTSLQLTRPTHHQPARPQGYTQPTLRSRAPPPQPATGLPLKKIQHQAAGGHRETRLEANAVETEASPPLQRRPTGLRRIANLHGAISKGSPQIEDLMNHAWPPLPEPSISTVTRGYVQQAHIPCVRHLLHGTLLLNIDGSKVTHSVMASTWDCRSTGNPWPNTCLEGKCCIGSTSDIDNKEIQVIQEGLRDL